MKKLFFGTLLLILCSSQGGFAQNGTIPKNTQVHPKLNVPNQQEALIKDKTPLIVVTTISANMILTTSASIYFSVVGSPISEKGVCYSINPNPTINNAKNNKPSGSNDNLQVLITNLKPNTTYYVKAYAKSGDKVFYGAEISFKTKSEEENKNPKVEPKKEPKEENPKK